MTDFSSEETCRRFFADALPEARPEADKDYEETAAAVADKAPLTPDEEAELNRLWKKLIKLYHPDRFAHEPDKLANPDHSVEVNHFV